MERRFLYHKKPTKMQGDTLYPLNQLRELYPEVYTQEIKKYTETERAELMKTDVIPLGVKWNDVIHLSPIDPEEIKSALAELGRYPELEHFQIDSTELDPNNTTIYVDSGQPIAKEDFYPYTPENLARFSRLPDETKQHYKEEVEKGRKPFLHHRAPHILHKGEIKLK